MNNRLVLIAACASALLLGACSKTPADTAKDVADARTDANQVANAADSKVADAQQAYATTDQNALKKLTAAESEAMISTARANFDVANTDAQGRASIAREKCGSLAGAEKDACLSSAEAALASDQAAAIATRDAALVAAERHD
jgi:hypothetical protein